MQDFKVPAVARGTCSIDRATALFFAPMLSAWTKEDGKQHQKKISWFCGLVEDLLRDQLDPEYAQGGPTELYAHHYRLKSGIDIQIGPKMPVRCRIKNPERVAESGTDEDKKNGYIDEYVAPDFGVRVEWNPSKSSLSSASPLLRAFRKLSNPGQLIKFARLDIAVDYPHKLVPQLILCDRMRKGFIAYGTEGVETVYFGSRQSKNYIRIYDKAKEQLQKHGLVIPGDLWRMEAERKEAFSLGENPVPGIVDLFRRIHAYDGGVSSGDWLMDMIRAQAMGSSLAAVLGTMPSATAKRYRKKFKELAGSGMDHPADIVEISLPSQLDALKLDVLKACEIETTTQRVEP